MKFLPKIVLVLTAAASCAAGAASVLTPEQDQARRDRNREEALAAYHASAQSRGDSAVYSGSAKMSHTTHTDTGWKAKTQHAEDKVQADAASAGHTVATKTDKATKPVRDFTHHELNKLRDFSARQDAHYGKTAANQNGDAVK
jgi:hypothetical protein